MYVGFKSQCVPEYRLLTEKQIRQIHNATLNLLESVGVKVDHEEARNMLVDAGCRVKDDHTVLFPNWIVDDAIRSAPSRITIYDQRGEDAMLLEGRRVHYGMGTDLVMTYDLDSGELRDSRLKDVVQAAVIADYLDDIDFSGSYALAKDVPHNLMYIASFKAQLEHCNKPIFYTAAGLEDVQVINRMAAVVAGGWEELAEKPFHIHYAEPLTPLAHSFGAVQKLFYCADKRVPVNYTPGMMSGGSAPVTLAGAVTVGNAEALSGLVMHQLRAKGAPIISGFGTSTLDMRTTCCIYACPEYRLALSACADLYHYYGIPMWGTGGVSDANCLDQQAGFEFAVSTMTDHLNGANLVHDIGYLGQGLIGHPGALVMCAEIINYVRRFGRGFEISDDRIGLDVIREVGPGGEFVSNLQTLKLFREEHWMPGLINRDNIGNWQAKGSKDWGQRATEKAREILAGHKPLPKPPHVQKTLNELGDEAEKALVGVHFRA